MASIPSQRSSTTRPQRRASPSTAEHENQSPNNINEENYYASSSIHLESSGGLLEASTSSVDSQTVFLNQPSTTSTSTSTSAHPDDTHQNTTASSQPSTSADANAHADQNQNSTNASSVNAAITAQETRKCWICFNDETEDPPDASPWRNPCPCALTAHEACLLDWIADLESPSATRSTVGPADLKCPQCKSEIKLARPRSYVVEAVSKLEKLANKMLIPTVVGGVGYTMLLGCSAHGAHSIRMVFGATAAEEILAPLEQWEWSWLEVQAQRYLPLIAGPFFRGWRGLRVELGLPLIPLTLVASRTTLADAILPVLPIVFFATHSPSYRTLELGHWPPSAALTLVLLPYIRSAYDEYINRVWAAKERGWVNEVRPRLGQDQTQAGNENADAAAVAADVIHDVGQDGIELGIEVEIIEEEEDEVEDNNAVAPNQGDLNNDADHGDDNNRANHINVGEEFAAAARQNQQQQQPQHQQRRQNQNNHHERPRDTDLLPYISRATDSIIGALLFPTLASISGEILKLLLPHSWTAHPSPFFTGFGSSTRWGGRKVAPTGLLQTKWGRSIVGGCLLVVLKDAVRIYCRWRMAVSFRSRRVVDFDRSKQTAGTSSSKAVTGINRAGNAASTSRNRDSGGGGGGSILAGQAVHLEDGDDNQ